MKNGRTARDLNGFSLAGLVCIGSGMYEVTEIVFSTFSTLPSPPYLSSFFLVSNKSVVCSLVQGLFRRRRVCFDERF
ncbi:hypothetical protein F4820DRAFT_412285 [Hypoxylon rubiginosum]|uniref:Uncharacterized protein n=1 Tax=Hypoxylon rubiginosum TaxID=110542 RepID=A0ACB9Z8J2_9PEZI|nr:hypothetical protein F4820DRAFT_412285 [Hypoxylon rubiginosum]